MLIGVISDTHVPHASSSVPATALKAFEDVDLILHAGDLVDLSVVRILEKIAPVKAVAGNMDSAEVKELLPERRIVEAGKYRIGLIHRSGRHRGFSPDLRHEFSNVEAVVFGHSHRSFVKFVDGVLFFNPGSPIAGGSGIRPSVGILELGSAIIPHIIPI